MPRTMIPNLKHHLTVPNLLTTSIPAVTRSTQPASTPTNPTAKTTIKPPNFQPMTDKQTTGTYITDHVKSTTRRQTTTGSDFWTMTSRHADTEFHSTTKLMTSSTERIRTLNDQHVTSQLSSETTSTQNSQEDSVASVSMSSVESSDPMTVIKSDPNSSSVPDLETTSLDTTSEQYLIQTSFVTPASYDTEYGHANDGHENLTVCLKPCKSQSNAAPNISVATSDSNQHLVTTDQHQTETSTPSSGQSVSWSAQTSADSIHDMTSHGDTPLSSSTMIPKFIKFDTETSESLNTPIVKHLTPYGDPTEQYQTTRVDTRFPVPATIPKFKKFNTIIPETTNILTESTTTEEDPITQADSTDSNQGVTPTIQPSKLGTVNDRADSHSPFVIACVVVVAVVLLLSTLVIYTLRKLNTRYERHI